MERINITSLPIRLTCTGSDHRFKPLERDDAILIKGRRKDWTERKRYMCVTSSYYHLLRYECVYTCVCTETLMLSLGTRVRIFILLSYNVANIACQESKVIGRIVNRKGLHITGAAKNWQEYQSVKSWRMWLTWLSTCGRSTTSSAPTVSHTL